MAVYDVRAEPEIVRLPEQQWPDAISSFAKWSTES
jgi:hypothetical protein